VAAAIEAAFLGLPAIAISLYLKRDVPPDYARTALLARQCIETDSGGGPERRAGGECEYSIASAQ